MSFRARMRKSADDGKLCCSFCRKAEGVAGKLISNPSDYPRAYICDECIAVCASIIEDDRQEADSQKHKESGGFLQHPLAPELLAAVERWAILDLQGLAASKELDQVRALAAAVLREQGSPE